MVQVSSQQEFSDADFRVVAAGDQSKKLKFNASGISANTTRTLTVQNADGTIAYVNNQTFTGTTTVNVLSVTGGQIAFPATENPSSNANTLDDYEEGTWTVTWTASSNPSLGNGSLAGRYTKIGRLVNALISLQVGSSTTFGAGAWIFSLPMSANVSGSGGGMANDNSAGQSYACGSYMAATADVRVATPTGRATGTVPFTWGNADRLDLTVVYDT